MCARATACIRRCEHTRTGSTHVRIIVAFGHAYKVLADVPKWITYVQDVRYLQVQVSSESRTQPNQKNKDFDVPISTTQHGHDFANCWTKTAANHTQRSALSDRIVQRPNRCHKRLKNTCHHQKPGTPSALHERQHRRHDRENRSKGHAVLYR